MPDRALCEVTTEDVAVQVTEKEGILPDPGQKVFRKQAMEQDCGLMAAFVAKISEPARKRQRTYLFHKEWEERYCFMDVNGKSVCLICSSTVAVAKKHNVQRHFERNHGTFAKNYPLDSELRKMKVKEMKSKFASQLTVYTKPVVHSKNTTIASFKIASLLVKRNKPFEDGELLKEVFLTAADSIFEGFSNKKEILTAIQKLQLSGNTFTSIEPVVSFFENPFSPIDVAETAVAIGELCQALVEEVEMEIVGLQNDIILKSNTSHANFWNLVDAQKFPLLRKTAAKIKSYFGSTYQCESVFSTRRFIKSKNRTRMTDKHLDDCLRVAISSYTPNYNRLADGMQCQASH
ncbi:hypothetical protein L345_10125, partial [Ophiophagus hannah]